MIPMDEFNLYVLTLSMIRRSKLMHRDGVADSQPLTLRVATLCQASDG